MNAPQIQITDQLFKSNLTFCVVCVFYSATDEWCAHNRLLNEKCNSTKKNMT
jgi:hypothetical protein